MALMATVRKRICTRSSRESEIPIPEMVLRSAMEELRQMQEKHALQQQRQELVTMLRQWDEKFLQLRKRIAQLSLFYNRISRESELNVNMRNDECAILQILGSYKLKPDIYDECSAARIPRSSS